jgi:hypothetical protein
MAGSTMAISVLSLAIAVVMPAVHQVVRAMCGEGMSIECCKSNLSKQMTFND